MFSNVPCRCFESGAVTPTHSCTIRSPDPRPHRTKGQKNRVFSRLVCPSPRLSPGEPDRPESPSRAQPHALRRWAWTVGWPHGPRIDLQEPEIKTPGHGAGQSATETPPLRRRRPAAVVTEQLRLKSCSQSKLPRFGEPHWQCQRSCAHGGLIT